MNLLRGMTIFVEVVEVGTMAGAAASLGVSATVVSSWVAQLEDYLGVRLLERTTRRTRITQEGQEYYHRCKQILADIEEAGEAVTVGRSTPRGMLRITAPVALGRRQVAPLVPAYKERYPEVRIELVLSDRIVDLEEEGFDLAVRSWRPQDSHLIARRLAPLHRVVCAAPNYLKRHGTPRVPADLAGHRCLTLGSGRQSDDVWHFKGETGPESVHVSGDLTSNNTEVLAEWALAGMGLAMKSTWDVVDEIRDGRLVVVLSEYMIEEHALYALYPDRRYLPARVRTFIDFMARRLRSRDRQVMANSSGGEVSSEVL